MKPTVEDQLQGTCRVLETVVAPCVADPMARTILDGLIANLRMLTDAASQVPGFLRADNDNTARLLSWLRESQTAGLADRITQALAEPEPDATDSVALDARNSRLRELLALAVCSDGLSKEQHSAIIKHMTDRASRVPMRYVPTAPTPTPASKS